MLNRRDVEKMTPVELRQQRAELHEALALADQRNDGELHDDIYRSLDLLNAELRLKEQREIDEREQALIKDNNRRRANGYETTDAILRPDQSLRAYMQSHGMIRDRQFEELGVGQLMRAMALGPKSDLERRALAEGSDSTGGITVPDITYARFFDRLRAAAVTFRAGAMVVPLDSDKNTIARLDADAVAGWRSENAPVDVDDPTFGGVVFTPRSLAVIIKTSRELLEDSLNITEMLEMSLLRSFATEIDKVALVGSGTPPEPRGVVNFTGVPSVDAAGALTSYDKLLDTLYATWKENNPNVSAMVMHPRTFVVLQKLKEGTTSAPLAAPSSVAAVPILQTTSIPITDDPAGNKSKLILGDFSKLLVGVRAQARIEILRELYAGNHQYGFLCHARVDTQVSHVKAFAFLHGIA